MKVAAWLRNAFAGRDSAAASEAVVPRYGIFEQSFTHSGTHTNPYIDLSAKVIFTKPGGGTATIPMFYDGGMSWKVRFSPALAGTWRWKTRSRNPGLHGTKGIFLCVESPNRGSIRRMPGYPYHFAYQDGTPFFFLGDTEWELCANLAEQRHDHDAVFQYLATRSSEGYTAVHFKSIGFWEDRTGAANDGGKPFWDLAEQRLNADYFKELDARVSEVNRQGMVAGMVVVWSVDHTVGFGAWKNLLRYYRYITARYSAFNLYFIVAGEWNRKRDPFTPREVRALGATIAANDPHGRMIAVHPSDVTTDAGGELQQSGLFAQETWCGFGDYQQVRGEDGREGPDRHAYVLRARIHEKPVVNGEGGYYQMAGGSGSTMNLADMRRWMYMVYLAGGYFVTGYGSTYNGGLTRETNPEPSGEFCVAYAPNREFTAHVRHLKRLFTSLEWWRLQPSDHLVTGAAPYRYVLAETGKQYLVYLKGSDAAQHLSLGGVETRTYTVQRFDPRTGAYTPWGRYTGTGPVALTPPNADDWLFILTAAPE